MNTRILFTFVLLSLLLTLFPYSSAFAQGPIDAPPPPPDGIPMPAVTPIPFPRIMPPPIPPRPIPVPFPEIKYHRVEVKIEGQVALTKVEMLFVNNSSIMLEGTYLFPLPAEAAISSLVMYADGQKMVGEIMDKEQARQIYESIVRQRRDPALLQYVGSRAVELRVFPIPPKGERKIQIEYSHFLKSDSGLIKYAYPLAGTSFPGSNIKELSITVQIKAREALRNVYSSSHEIGISKQGDRTVEASYEASNVTSLKDFELNYSLSEKEVSLNVLAYKNGNKGYFLLLIAPPLEIPRSEVVARDIIMVVDVSGSMVGTKLEQAKEAMKNVLDRLNPQDRFNIIAFHSSVSSYADSLRPVSERNEALRYTNDLRALGSTNIHGALARALSMVSEARPSVILLLTDGRPTVGVTDEKGILSLMSSSRRDFLRIFTFGIGDDVDASLLDNLAQRGRGTSQYIKRDDEIKTLVTSLYEKISTPVLLGLKLDFGRMRVEEVYPAPLPDLYGGSQLLVAGRYLSEGYATITLTGRSSLKEERFVYDKVNFSPSTTASFIPAQWATKKIGYLLEQIKLKGENREIVDEIKALSQQYGIMTPYTSYFVKEDMPMPVPMPAPMPMPALQGAPGLKAGPPGPAGKAGPARPGVSGGSGNSAGAPAAAPSPAAQSETRALSGSASAPVEAQNQPSAGKPLARRNPEIALSPGPVKGSIDVEGSGFNTGSAIQLLWEDKRIPTVPSTVFADSDGKFKATISSQVQQAGTYTITARDSSAESTAARAKFTIPERDIVSRNATAPYMPGIDSGVQDDRSAGLLQRLLEWILSLFKK